MRNDHVTKLQKKLDKVVELAVAVLYFDDRSDYGSALWDIINAVNSDAAVLLEEDPSAAFDKYVEHEERTA